MAVERLTDYTRRIWTALAADAPEGHDIQVNDVIYYMDTSQCAIVTYVYPLGSIDTIELPDVGGGGGGGINLRLIASGTYTQLNDTPQYRQFPVSLPDDKKVLFKITAQNREPLASNNKMTDWWRMYNDIFDYLDQEIFPAPQEARWIGTTGTAFWQSRASGNVNSMLWYTGDNIGFTVHDAGCRIAAGDYVWEVWGY